MILCWNLTDKIMEPLTTKVSSRGQVVIPEPIRTKLRLHPGAEFVVVAEDDVLVLKQLFVPSWEQFEGLVREARRQARSVRLTSRHIWQPLAKVRRGR